MHVHLHPHTADKSRAALFSILASAGLVVTKMAVAILTGSLALLTEALHSLLDLGATVVTYYAVNWADRPADASHHYGHGKIESLAALLEVAMLFFVAVFAIWHAIERLTGAPSDVSAPWIAIAIIAVSIVVDFYRARALHKTAHETGSQALEADALHFVSDMWASIAAFCALIGIALGFPKADAIAALFVAAVIIYISWELGYRTIRTLLDAAPAGTSELAEEAASHVSGVVKVSRTRIRSSGATNFIEIDVQVARTLSLPRIDEIKKDVIEAVQAKVLRADVTVTTEAVALEEESIMERVMLIAARQHAFVHHLTVQQLGGKLAIGLDLEIDENMSLSSAHASATKLETALMNEFGEQTEVETHIEPLENMHAIHDAPENERAEVEAFIKKTAAGIPHLSNIHAFRLRNTASGRIIILHCQFPPQLSVRAVHDAVDMLEREVRVHYPNILRILIHPEPINVSHHHH
ncbi:MAG: cation diffusion facilitator family transporter [Pseudomonadota bacterium]